MSTRKRRSDRAGRGILCSPGRPGVARREDRRRFWTAIAAGLASEDAACRAGVSPAVGTRWFREAGGMPPAALAPSSKPLSGRYLSLAEREEIALCRAQGQGVREVARRLGRGLAGVVATSGGAAVRGPVVPWKGRRQGHRKNRQWARAWSPEQIAQRLRLDFPGDETMRISHEAIYQALYVQGRGAVRRELTARPRAGRGPGGAPG